LKSEENLRVNYFKALYGYNLARARLARAMGTY
jgi:hypothetical protein